MMQSKRNDLVRCIWTSFCLYKYYFKLFLSSHIIGSMHSLFCVHFSCWKVILGYCKQLHISGSVKLGQLAVTYLCQQLKPQFAVLLCNTHEYKEVDPPPKFYLFKYKVQILGGMWTLCEKWIKQLARQVDCAETPQSYPSKPITNLKRELYYICGTKVVWFVH